MFLPFPPIARCENGGMGPVTPHLTAGMCSTERRPLGQQTGVSVRAPLVNGALSGGSALVCALIDLWGVDVLYQATNKRLKSQEPRAASRWRICLS